jgi:hypothetical protein
VDDPGFFDETAFGHPAEAGFLLPHDEEAYEDGAPPVAHATTVAARVSIGPSALGPHTTVDGRALLALTVCGVDLPSAPGPG